MKFVRSHYFYILILKC